MLPLSVKWTSEYKRDAQRHKNDVQFDCQKQAKQTKKYHFFRLERCCVQFSMIKTVYIFNVETAKCTDIFGDEKLSFKKKPEGTQISLLSLPFQVGSSHRFENFEISFTFPW